MAFNSPPFAVCKIGPFLAVGSLLLKKEPPQKEESFLTKNYSSSCLVKFKIVFIMLYDIITTLYYVVTYFCIPERVNITICSDGHHNTVHYTVVTQFYSERHYSGSDRHHGPVFTVHGVCLAGQSHARRDIHYSSCLFTKIQHAWLIPLAS